MSSQLVLWSWILLRLTLVPTPPPFEAQTYQTSELTLQMAACKIFWPGSLIIGKDADLLHGTVNVESRTICVLGPSWPMIGAAYRRKTDWERAQSVQGDGYQFHVLMDETGRTPLTWYRAYNTVDSPSTNRE